MEGAGVLAMRTVDNKAKCRHRSPGVEPHRKRALEINVGDKFALSQIGNHFVAQVAWDAEGKADA